MVPFINCVRDTTFARNDFYFPEDWCVIGKNATSNNVDSMATADNDDDADDAAAASCD